VGQNLVTYFDFFDGLHTILCDNFLAFEKAAQDWIHPNVVAGLLKPRPRVTGAVVGDRGGAHPELIDPADKVLRLLRAVKKRGGGVVV
jgi:hypothetical protein